MEVMLEASVNNKSGNQEDDIEEVVDEKGYETVSDSELGESQLIKKGRGRPRKVVKNQTKIDQVFIAKSKLKRTPVKKTNEDSDRKKQSSQVNESESIKKVSEKKWDGLESMKEDITKIVKGLKETIDSNEKKIKELEAVCNNLSSELEFTKRELQSLKRPVEKNIQVKDSNNNGKNTILNDATERNSGIEESTEEHSVSDVIIKPDALSRGEWFFEKRERDLRRRSVKISGIEGIRGGLENIVKILENKMQMVFNFINIYPIENGAVCMEFASMGDKFRILKSKKKLKGQRIWLEDDWTPREVEVQNYIYKIAEKEIEKGNEVRVGYQKIIVQGNKLVWNESKAELEPAEKIQLVEGREEEEEEIKGFRE